VKKGRRKEKKEGGGKGGAADLERTLIFAVFAHDFGTGRKMDGEEEKRRRSAFLAGSSETIRLGKHREGGKRKAEKEKRKGGGEERKGKQWWIAGVIALDAARDFCDRKGGAVRKGEKEKERKEDGAVGS